MGGGYSGTLALIPYLATQRARDGVEGNATVRMHCLLTPPRKPKFPTLVCASSDDTQDGIAHHNCQNQPLPFPHMCAIIYAFLCCPFLLLHPFFPTQYDGKSSLMLKVVIMGVGYVFNEEIGEGCIDLSSLPLSPSQGVQTQLEIKKDGICLSPLIYGTSILS